MKHMFSQGVFKRKKIKKMINKLSKNRICLFKLLHEEPEVVQYALRHW